MSTGKRGPKTIDQYSGKLKKHTVLLDSETVKVLRQYGLGKISPGIRVVASLAKEENGK